MTAEQTLLDPIETPSAAPAAAAAPAAPTVTVFSKNDCGDCIAVKDLFTRKGVPFTEINVQVDEVPRAEFGGLAPVEYVKANYGTRMPTIVVTDDEWGDWWSGRRVDKISETVARFRDADLLIPEEQRVMP